MCTCMSAANKSQSLELPPVNFFNACWSLLLGSFPCILCLCLFLDSTLIYSALCCTSVVRLQR